MLRHLLVPLALTGLAACSITHSRAGNDNVWRGAPDLERGVTTMAQVLDALGPPAQVYDFRERVAFMYLLIEERRRGYDAYVLKDTHREYLTDRAVYFFDQSGRLEEVGFSRVELPREEAYERDPWSPPAIDGVLREEAP